MNYIIQKMESVEEKEKSLCEEYLATLSPKESKAYHIAKSHLGSSFSLEKSNGFIEWKKKRDSIVK